MNDRVILRDLVLTVLGGVALGIAATLGLIRLFG